MLRLLYDHGAWANRRVLDTAETLTPDQMGTPVLAGLGSVHDTLVHTLSAQRLWLARWQGTSPTSMLDPADYPDRAAVRTRWEETEGQTRAFVAALGTDEDHAPVRIVTYTNARGQTWSKPLWQLMLQQATRATQHRSEIAAMLTHFGQSPGWLDLVIFLDAPGVHP